MSDIQITRYQLFDLPDFDKKNDLFKELKDANISYDVALPQTVMNAFMDTDHPFTYHAVLLTTVWAYPEGDYFGQPVSICTEIQEAWDKFMSLE